MNIIFDWIEHIIGAIILLLLYYFADFEIMVIALLIGILIAVCYSHQEMLNIIKKRVKK